MLGCCDGVAGDDFEEKWRWVEARNSADEGSRLAEVLRKGVAGQFLPNWLVNAMAETGALAPAKIALNVRIADGRMVSSEGAREAKKVGGCDSLHKVTQNVKDSDGTW